MTCNKDRCIDCVDGTKLKVKKNIRAHDGVCYDCTAYPNSIDCDDKGAFKCDKGFYVDIDEEGIK